MKIVLSALKEKKKQAHSNEIMNSWAVQEEKLNPISDSTVMAMGDNIRWGIYLTKEELEASCSHARGDP